MDHKSLGANTSAHKCFGFQTSARMSAHTSAHRSTEIAMPVFFHMPPLETELPCRVYFS